MDSRKRVRLILNHQEADRPAIDLGGTHVTGMSIWTYRALKEALGVGGGRARVGEIMQMLAEIEPFVQDALGGDFRTVPQPSMSFGLQRGKWKPYTFWDGQTFEVPAGFAPKVHSDGSLELVNPNGHPVRLPNGGWFFDDLVPRGYQDSLEIELIPESEWKFTDTLPEDYLCEQEMLAKDLYESTDKALVACPPLRAPQGYCGSWWPLILRTEPDHCLEYMMRAGEAAAKCFTEYLEAVGDYIDVVGISYTDYGYQDREAFRPHLFQEFFVPSWKLVTDAIHRFPHVKTFIHCDGSVPNLVPYFIEAGVDCLNPVQWTAQGMDLRWLKTAFGERIVFWGGAISTQRTLPFGSAEDVTRETQEVLKIMAPGGGFVAAAIHNILPEVPVENILALYLALRAYRYR